VIFAGPVPILSNMALISSLQTWIFTPKSSQQKVGTPFQLPPATVTPGTQTSSDTAELVPNARAVLPLLAGDPLSFEQFCLVLTPGFSLVMVLGEDISDVPAFLFSFEPKVAEQAWQSLRARVVLTSPHFPISQLDTLVEKYYPVAPDYRTVTQFSRLLLKHLPEAEEARGERQEERSRGAQERLDTDSPLHRKSAPAQKEHSSVRPDVELLQAFAHEVRTPLTTIRTLTRLLLKRRDLATDTIKRLEIIDHECTEQIDRMELLFRAAELETSTLKQTSAHLTATSLAQVLQQSIPRWQKQASRRNLTLDVVLPQQLPTVVSDPTMLDQVLTGLIENFTRSLPTGSHIQVQVIPAGDQLKLQLLSQSQPGESGTAEIFPVPPTRKSLGQMLMFQPETGNISLNLTATKHLFQAIGGKLIVRQRPHQGEVLTIFLPMDLRGAIAER
jgi:signal transduction histidine kinase